MVPSDVSAGDVPAVTSCFVPLVTASSVVVAMAVVGVVVVVVVVMEDVVAAVVVVVVVVVVLPVTGKISNVMGLSVLRLR